MYRKYGNKYGNAADLHPEDVSRIVSNYRKTGVPVPPELLASPQSSAPLPAVQQSTPYGPQPMVSRGGGVIRDATQDPAYDKFREPPQPSPIVPAAIGDRIESAVAGLDQRAADKRAKQLERHAKLHGAPRTGEAKPRLLKRDELANYVPAGEFEKREEAEAAGAEAVGQSDGKWYALNKRKAEAEAPTSAAKPDGASLSTHDAIMDVASSLLTPEGRFEGDMRDAVNGQPISTHGMMPLSAVKRGVEEKMGRKLSTSEWREALNDLRVSQRVRLTPNNTGKLSPEVEAAGIPSAHVGHITYLEIPKPAAT
jgi:hypothetical protein